MDLGIKVLQRDVHHPGFRLEFDCIIYRKQLIIPIKASTFKKCNRKEADFNKCLTNAVQDAFHQLNKAHPEVDLPSLDPFVYPVGLVRVGKGTSVVQFTHVFKHTSVKKFTEFSSLKASMDFDTNVLTLEIEYPTIIFNFDYEIDGKILTIPIKGQGPGQIHLKNFAIELTFTLKEENNYYKVANGNFAFKKMENVWFNFENLFDGNKELGDKVNAAMNENWKGIFEEMQDKYEKINAKTFTGIFSKFLEKVPARELFGEP
ncbi:circadian clock-controlled protein daywake-like [Zophobas morio]|uniref:circadian clock-controlled protein daywake-like n=1 Tax=Zophobas morio TaxID=2755281 RepID=UPI00308372AA